AVDHRDEGPDESLWPAAGIGFGRFAGCAGVNRVAGPEWRGQKHVHEVPVAASANHIRFGAVAGAGGGGGGTGNSQASGLHAGAGLSYTGYGGVRVCDVLRAVVRVAVPVGASAGA